MPRALGRLAGVVGDGGRVGALLVLDDLHADPLGPDAPVGATAPARNVSLAQTITFLFISFFSSQASLAMLVVLPAPLTPATRMTVGPEAANRSSRSAGGQFGQHLLAHDPLGLLGVADLAQPPAVADRPDDPLDVPRPDVGLVEPLLQLAPGTPRRSAGRGRTASGRR